VIDETGAKILPIAYDGVEYAGDGKYRVELDDRYGVIDETGVEILPVQHDRLTSLGGGLFEARLGDRHGILDIDGNRRISFSDYEVLVD
jgi:hypothetical protein